MSSMAVYQPQCLLREVAVDPRQAAVLFIDVQNLNCHRGGAIYRNHTQEELEVRGICYFVVLNFGTCHEAAAAEESICCERCQAAVLFIDVQNLNCHRGQGGSTATTPRKSWR
jgi:nicotinamidase-related amidase